MGDVTCSEGEVLAPSGHLSLAFPRAMAAEDFPRLARALKSEQHVYSLKVGKGARLEKGASRGLAEMLHTCP